MKRLQTDIEWIKQGITDIKGVVNTQNAKIDTLECKCAALEARCVGLETKIGVIEKQEDRGISNKDTVLVSIISGIVVAICVIVVNKVW